MKDYYDSSASGPTVPAENYYAIVPGETFELVEGTKRLYGDMGRNIILRGFRRQAGAALLNVPSGTILDGCIRAVRATDIAAYGIVVLV